MNRDLLSAIIGKDFKLYFSNRFFALVTVLSLVAFTALYFLLPNSVDETLELGLTMAGMPAALQEMLVDEEVEFYRAESVEALQQAVLDGDIPAGYAFPDDFLAQLRSGSRPAVQLYLSPDVPPELHDIYAVILDELAFAVSGQTTAMVAYIWGESLMKNRAMLVAAMTTWVRAIAGQRSPVEIVATVLGDAAALSWQARLLPFIVLMALVFGGVMLPASSLVTEKQHRTLAAVSITPATMGDIYAAKGVMAVAISTTMALITLALNRALGDNTILLIGVLVLGAIMAAEFGVLLGMWVKDVNSLFATIKSIGILLHAPALIYMFPEIPQWIAKIFPTNYIIEPVIEVAQRGASLADVAWQLVVLAALIVALAVGLALLTRRRQRQE
jgi:ABC-2 type transport system permease protein